MKASDNREYPDSLIGNKPHLLDHLARLGELEVGLGGVGGGFGHLVESTEWKSGAAGRVAVGARSGATAT